MEWSAGGILDNRAVRQALEASEARFHNIIARNADGILVVAPEGTIRYANPAATRLLGRSSEELVGRDFGIPIVPGETTEVDLWIAPGEVRVAELRSAPTEWEEQPAYLATLRDVSERKRLEEQLRQKVSELAEADRRKDEFLAMLAHELRNPLAPITNAARILEYRGNEPETVANLRGIIEQQVKSLGRLVDDLLDVSRITRGKIRLRKEPILLSHIVERAVSTSRHLLDAKRHTLRQSLPKEPVKLLADPVRIEQVLVNLLSNAAKYTDPGGTIDLDCRVEGGELVVSIRDDGIGLNSEMLERIFDLFSQVDHSLDRAQGGLGIGLTLSRRLAELHGGRLTAHSGGVGQGSEFRLRLPLPDPDSAPAPSTALDTRASAKPSRRVLVVDDHMGNAESLSMILEIWGHKATMVVNGAEALRMAPVFRPEIVLLDIGLPGLDGFAVAAQLLANPEFPSPTLIAMTGYGRDEDRRRALEAGFAHFLVKPIDLDVLERLLDIPALP